MSIRSETKEGSYTIGLPTDEETLRRIRLSHKLWRVRQAKAIAEKKKAQAEAEAIQSQTTREES